MDSGPFQVAGATRNLREPSASTPIGADSELEVTQRGNAPLVISSRRRSPSPSHNSSEQKSSLGPTVRRASLRIVTAAGDAADDEAIIAPERNYECDHYETCLGLAAALNWKSFTCGGCCGEVNQQLLWRAHHHIRNNPALSKLCSLPTLRES